MQFKKTKLISLLLLSFASMQLYAQDATVATGGNASGSGGSVSYSIGQVSYTTNIGATGSVAQGVQQAYEISVVTALEETQGIDLSFSVYPNPTIAEIKLKIENYPSDNLSYQLYDISGKILESKKLDNTETSIAMGNYSAAIYFLKVIQNNKEIKTFKIIKN